MLGQRLAKRDPSVETIARVLDMTTRRLAAFMRNLAQEEAMQRRSTVHVNLGGGTVRYAR